MRLVMHCLERVHTGTDLTSVYPARATIADRAREGWERESFDSI